jgi:hypothetical protein
MIQYSYYILMLKISHKPYHQDSLHIKYKYNMSYIRTVEVGNVATIEK